ncbi:MAG: N-acetylmuramoyl-L-alanine amidase [Thermoanaerobaculia bacterium]|nr:N-acetylmuramoyl-L-alanine amidase [Thermoanaerobaculia bacterium]
MRFSDEWMIPVAPGQAVDWGWAPSGGAPKAVTWHWTATADLARCDALIGGASAERQGRASAHYGIGRSFEEGIHRYVSLANRSWHAGKNQTLRWDGRPMESEDDKGARTCIGVETVNVGFARDEFPADRDWISAASVDGRRRMLVQPWTEEQVELMIAVGWEIIGRWPHLGPRDHHGHHDLCPGYKLDVAGFPFARVLRGIYQDESIPDVWSGVWTPRGRRAALRQLRYGPLPPVDVDVWTRLDDLALRRFQADQDHQPDGLWTTAVSWKVWEAQGGNISLPPDSSSHPLDDRA